MTDNEMRIAIAEACGWHVENSGNVHSDLIFNPEGNSCKRWKRSETGWTDQWLSGEALPDFVNDLNAMHEAEKTISELRHEAYYIHLSATTRENLGHYGFPLITATARQRAEAFLRTIGKWRD